MNSIYKEMWNQKIKHEKIKTGMQEEERTRI